MSDLVVQQVAKEFPTRGEPLVAKCFFHALSKTGASRVSTDRDSVVQSLAGDARFGYATVRAGSMVLELGLPIACVVFATTARHPI